MSVPQSKKAEKQGRSSRVAFVVVALCAFLAMASSAYPSPLYAVYKTEFSMSTASVCGVYAVYAAGVVFALYFMSSLSGAIGRKFGLVLGLLLLAGSCLVFGIAHSLAVLMLARILQGVAIGILTGAIGPALGSFIEPHNAHVAAYANSAATTLGIPFGGLFAGWVCESFNYSVAIPFWVLFVGSLILAAAVLVFVPDGDSKKGGSVVSFRGASVPEAIRNNFFVGAAGIFVAWAVGGVFLGLGGIVVRSAFGNPDLVLAGLCLVCIQGVGGLTQIVVSLRFSHFDSVMIMRAGTASLIVGMIVASLSLHMNIFLLFFVGAVIAGFGFGLGYMGATAIVQKSASAGDVAGVMAAYFTVGYIGISVPALIVGVLIEHFSLFAVMAGFTGAVMILGGLLLAKSRRMRIANQ